jgi:pyruvate ferredoxin oxidoreductase gamma subunit
MWEVRFHGRGGQGAVTAASLLAKAAFLEGKFCQAFPFFGAERRGAPVVAFTRVDDKPIRVRTQIYEPDYVVVLDPTIPGVVDVGAGLKEGGTVVVNATEAPKGVPGKVMNVDATSIATEILGRPITNTTMLGAFAGATGLVSLDSITKAIQEKFGGEIGEKNAAAARAAYERVKK